MQLEATLYYVELRTCFVQLPASLLCNVNVPIVPTVNMYQQPKLSSIHWNVRPFPRGGAVCTYMYLHSSLVYHVKL